MITKDLLTSEHWQLLARLLHLSVAELQLSTFFNIAVVTECFRLFRNACVDCQKNQNFIIRSDCIIEDAVRLLTFLIDRHEELFSEEVTVNLRCCLQFMGNLIVQNVEAQNQLWSYCYLKLDVFSVLLNSKDEKVKEYTAMLFYNCLIPLHTSHLISTDKGKTLINNLINYVVEESSDWSLLCMEKFIQEEAFITELYDSSPLKNRFAILDMMAEQLSRCKDQNFELPLCSIAHISTCFKNSSLNIVKLCTPGHSSLEPLEIIKLLSVLCLASAKEYYSSLFKDDFDLLETAVDVLKSVHFLGKTGGNAFSPIHSLKAENEVRRGEVESHPAFGFKRDLIRLIGNLVAHSKGNQDAVRNMDGIPLLLDCCNIDSRNPYILQWCILAIRNLLNKNPENQAAVANISVTGDLVNSPLLKELGFTIECYDGQFILKSDIS